VAEKYKVVPTRYDGPTGIVGVLQEAAGRAVPGGPRRRFRRVASGSGQRPRREAELGEYLGGS
jgi:hypothetical protein